MSSTTSSVSATGAPVKVGTASPFSESSVPEMKKPSLEKKKPSLMEKIKQTFSFNPYDGYDETNVFSCNVQ